MRSRTKGGICGWFGIFLAASSLVSGAAPVPEADQGVPVKKPAFRRISPGGREALLSPPDGSTIYQNEVEPLFYATSRPNTVLEEVSVINNTSPLEITGVELGVDVSVAVPLRVAVRFWNVLNTAATPVNSGLLGAESIDFGSFPVSPGFFVVAETLTNPIFLTDTEIAVQVDFFNSTTFLPLNGEATIMFAGGGPTVGSSNDWYYRDANNNGQFDPGTAGQGGDQRSFLGNPGLANFMMHLRGLLNPNSVDPGIDLYQTPTNGMTFENLVAEPGLFDACSPGLGYSSTGFSQAIPLKSKALVTDPAEVLAPADTIVQRNDLLFLNNPGDFAQTSIQLIALSLQSSTPVTINYSNGSTTIPSQWDVFVCLSNVPQVTGMMTITRGACTDEGGTFTANLPVLPKLIFSRRGSPSCLVTVDQGVRGVPPINYTFSGHWLNYDPVNFNLIQEPVGNLVQADGNCDGVFDAAMPATTDTFHSGARVLRCTGVSCATPGTDPVSRQATLVASGAQQMLLATVEKGPDDDLDGVPDTSDNCGGYAPQPVSKRIANASQADTDDDGYGDACDNCVSTCNLDQVNSDGDAFGDACDCNVSDPLNPKPGEALNVHVASDKRTWTWNTVALATTYNVLRGALNALPVGPGGGDETCFSGLASATLVDATNPTHTTGFWYLPRGRNNCGGGTYGKQEVHGVAGPERISTTCP